MPHAAQLKCAECWTERDEDIKTYSKLRNVNKKHSSIYTDIEFSFIYLSTNPRPFDLLETLVTSAPISQNKLEFYRTFRLATLKPGIKSGMASPKEFLQRSTSPSLTLTPRSLSGMSTFEPATINSSLTSSYTVIHQIRGRTRITSYGGSGLT